jgi:hypothetical protein
MVFMSYHYKYSYVYRHESWVMVLILETEDPLLHPMPLLCSQVVLGKLLT